MRRGLLVSALAFALLAPAARAGVRVSAEIPSVATTGDVVRVRGSVSGRTTVVLQKRTADGWRRVGRARRATRRFSLSWRAPVRPGMVVLRVAAGRAVSAPGRVVIAPVEVVGPRSVSSAPAPGTAGSLRIAGRHHLRAGDFVAVGVGRATPYGLFGRIIAAHRSRRATVVDTQPAGLFEALPEGVVELGPAVARAAAAT